MYHQATEIRRELLRRVCELSFNGELEEEIDRIPLHMRPRITALSRCCVHKDRAVIKYRVMTILGFNVTDETDELTRLSDYARMSRERKEFTDVMLTVVDEACSSCVKQNYTVTNLCKACVGHPCTYACNKGAITMNGKAKIDPALCVNCGRCLSACPFHAIVYTPVPCEEACPVGAISKNERGVEVIDWNKCVYCGKCKDACSFGAIMEKTYLVQISEEIKRKERRLVALVAPAFAGQYDLPYEKVLAAIKESGFDEVAEVALGANITSRKEADEWVERVREGGAPFMTTSCCPSYKAWAEKHLPALVPYISHTKTPAAYTAEIVKSAQPDCLTVFISPCIAKRVEGYYDENIDYVITFEEMAAIIEGRGIDIASCEPLSLSGEIEKSGRYYAKTGGVAASVAQYLQEKEGFAPLVVNGLDKESARMLKSIAQSGKADANMIEVMM
ncbi:MAG: monomeric [FeFe] hydrogenase, partial [Bacteroidales bacterium]|nr:monomeric [FeFe] hydrogenase [Bacteroidales bacterium]